VEQEIFGQIAVEKRIAVDLEEVFEHPEAESQAGSERRGYGERGASKAGRPGRLRSGRRETGWGQLTPESGFHTIRNV
jgi:hypothetical protein